MSHAQHVDSAGDNAGADPLKIALWVLIGSVALVVGLLLLVQFAIASYGSRSLENDPAMAPEALARRIAPVAKLQMADELPFAAPAAKVAPVAAAPAAGAKADGKTVYETACKACHASGIAGAPKLGDKAAWGLRIQAGMPALYASAIKGKGAMPPRGGHSSLADADATAAVDYMVAGSK